MTMLPFAASLLFASPLPPPAASAQAIATIRIVSAVRISLDGKLEAGVPQSRLALVHERNAASHVERLVEFQ